jgi:single-stranded DNA-binding protein
MHLLIEGDIRTREYTQRPDGVHGDSVKKTVTEICIASITKLDRPAKAAGPVGTTLPEDVPA